MRNYCNAKCCKNTHQPCVDEGRNYINLLLSAIFLKKIGSGTYSDPKFGQREGGASYIDAGKKRFQDAVPACVLRKNFQNSIPAYSITKIPLPLLNYCQGTYTHGQPPISHSIPMYIIVFSSIYI
jgi:hypothetical protein